MSSISPQGQSPLNGAGHAHHKHGHHHHKKAADDQSIAQNTQQPNGTSQPSVTDPQSYMA